MDNSLVSIIVPTYNRASRILVTLDSLLGQTYPSIEILVVDDGSTDDTENVIKGYKLKHDFNNKINYIKQSNGGAPSARNNGLKNSKGKYIVYFDSDDVMLAERIQEQVEKIEAENGDCCACGFYYNDETKSYIPPVINSDNLFKNVVNRDLKGSTQSWMYTKKCVEEVGGSDISMACYQDADLFVRVLKNNPKISIVQKPLSVFIDHDEDGRIMDKWSKPIGLESITNYYNNVFKLNLDKELKNSALLKYVNSTFTGYLKNGYYNKFKENIDFFSKEYNIAKSITDKLNLFVLMSKIRLKFYFKKIYS